MQGDSISSSKAVNNPLLCSSVKHYLPMHPTNNLEKILWNKYIQCLCWQDILRSTDTYLTITLSFAKPLPHQVG